MRGSFLGNGRHWQRLLQRHTLLDPHCSTSSLPHKLSNSCGGSSTLVVSSFLKQDSNIAYIRYRRLFRKQEGLGVSSRGFSSSSSYRSGFVEWYLKMIEKHPIPTKSFTASFIYTASDFCSQMIAKTPTDYFDSIRIMRMAGYGMVFSGPTLHLWFNFVSKYLPKRDMPSTFKKIVLGQVVYGPIMTVLFFSLNAALQGETGPEILGRLKRDLLPTLCSGLAYWPACDFITYKFIPVRLQPLVSNSFAFLWTIYITYMASLKKVSGDKVPVPAD